MAFIVEDGTVIDNANSYAAVADADSRATDRGETSWSALSNGLKQAALILATDFIERNFAARFIGYPSATGQSLSWPRHAWVPGQYATTGTDSLLGKDGRQVQLVPDVVKEATIDLAFIGAVDAALLSRGGSTLTGAAPIKRAKADTVEVEYDTSSITQLTGGLDLRFKQIEKSMWTIMNARSSRRMRA